MIVFYEKLPSCPHLTPFLNLPLMIPITDSECYTPFTPATANQIASNYLTLDPGLCLKETDVRLITFRVLVRGDVKIHNHWLQPKCCSIQLLCISFPMYIGC